MSFHSAEFAWNSVDVRGDDGLLHNGRVIDAVAAGLLVDFGTPGPSGLKVIPFSDVHHRQYSNYLSSVGQHNILAEEQPVELLLRVQPEDPWKWYPGQLLAPYGLVNVSLPDHQLQGVIVEQRIRATSTEESLARLRLSPGRFSKQLVAVPSGHGAALPSDDQLIDIFNTHCRQEHYWMMATSVNYPRHGLFKELVVLALVGTLCVGGYYYAVDGSPEGWPDHHGRTECHRHPEELLLSLLNTGANTADDGHFLSPAPAAPYHDGCIQFLYRDPSIFPQIFQCRTTAEQTQLRAVCKQWNAILTSGGIRRIITLSQPGYGLGYLDSHDYTINMYRFASCLYNCWTQHTRVLVFYNGSDPVRSVDAFLADVARLLRGVLAAKGLPAVEVLLLSGDWFFHVDEDANWANALCEVFVSLAGICRQLVFKNFEVEVVLYPFFRSYEDLVVRIVDKRITRHLTVSDFWAMLSNGLRELSATEVERLAEEIDDRSRLSEKWQIIARILNITQTLDPRNGVRYRGMSFSPRERPDGVDIRQLTRFTLHALLQYVDYYQRIIFHIF